MLASKVKRLRPQPVIDALEAKPNHIELDTEAFNTTEQRDAAHAILEHWHDTHSFQEIAERSGFSPSHISNVYYTYIRPTNLQLNGDRDVDVETLSEDNLRIYFAGYRAGVRDATREKR